MRVPRGMVRFARLPSRPFRFDYALIGIIVVGAAVLFAFDWMARNPWHDPRAPLVIDQREGWATPAKLAGLRADGASCRMVLERSGIAFDSLDAVGEGACRREDRLLPNMDELRGLAFAPRKAEATCAVHAGVAWWLKHRVQPAAERHFGSRVIRIEQLGTANCRRVNGGSSGRWSEHASGNAIDIAGFVLADGTTLSVARDWDEDGPAALFLREARDGACDVFGTTLSPDYNALHADHFHLDQANRGMGGYCR